MNDNKPIMSDKIDLLTKALVEAQRKIEPIGKGGEVDYTYDGKKTRYKYAKYTDMWKMVHKALCDNNLNFTCIPAGEVVYGLMSHSSGQFLGGWLDMKLTKNKYNKYDPQDVGEWVTYLSKYLFKAALNLPTDDDDATGMKGKAKREDQQEPEKAPESVDIFQTLCNATGMVESDVKAKLKKMGIDTKTQITKMGKEKVISILNGGTE